MATYTEYSNAKQEFLAKHNFDYKIITSGLNEYDGYNKTYSCTDGAAFYENMMVEYVPYEVEVKGIKIEDTVKMLRTEFYSSDYPYSKYYYERY